MIDTKALRSRVLDLAIRGKLTEQLESDGTAEELYQQIQAEKQTLIKEGKIKKEKPLPEISADEIPFEIPNNWKWINFGDIMWNRDSERIPVSVADRKKLKKVYDYYGASGIIDKVEDYLFDKRLLLIGEDGANLLSRSTPIAFMAEGKYWVNNHAHVLDCYIENYLDFVLYYINAISLVPYVTGSAQPKLNQDRMNKIPVPLPPLAEQKRIVERVEEIFRLLDAIDEAQEKYSADAESLKAKLITAGIQGKLTEQLDSDGTAEELYQQIQEEKQKLIKEGKIKKEKPLPAIKDAEVPFEIPGSWKWVRLKTVLLSASTGPFGSMLHKSDYAEIGVPLVNPADIVNSAVSTQKIKKVAFQKAEEMQGYSLVKGNIVIGRRGEMGRAAIITETEEGFLCGTGCFFIMPSDALFAPFFIRLLQTNEIRECLRQGSVGSTMDNLNHSILESLPIPLPPLAEQKRIVEVLERVMGAFFS